MAILKALGFPSLVPVAAAAAIAASLPSSPHPATYPSLKLASCTPPPIPFTPVPRTPPHLQRQPPQHPLPPHSMVGRAMPLVDTASALEAPLQEPASHTIAKGHGNALPELITEFMVNMKCEGCVSSVRKKLEPLEGVKKVDVDLANQVVRVLGSTTLKNLSTALEQTGRKARLIGQGSPSDFLISAAVAEFKGPQIHGVVRFAQVNMELARIDSAFSGLSPGAHGWSINEYGDLTQGAASTGKIFHPLTDTSNGSYTEPLGDLGTLVADSNGESEYSAPKPMLKVADLIGRALVVYDSEDKSKPGITAAVIARSAGVGENYKKLCTCDGTIIWESTNSDFVKV